MINSDAHLQTALGLAGWGADAPAIPSRAPDIEGLCKAIQSRNEPALDMLMNLCLAPGEAGRSATNALLMLYAAPETGEDVRDAVREFAFRLFGVSENSSSADSKHPMVSPDRIPTELLYLAGRHVDQPERRNRYAASLEKIETALRGRIDSAGAYKGAERQAGLHGLVDRGHLIGQSELVAVASHRRNLPAHASQLDLASPQTAVAIVQEVLQQIPRAGDARVVFMRTGDEANSHWVALVLCRNPANAVDCLLFDSARDGDKRANQVKAFLRQAGVPSDGQWLCAGGMLQSNAPNSCGVFCNLAHDALDRLRGAESDAGITRMAARLERLGAEVTDRDPQTQDARVTVARAAMLAQWGQVARGGQPVV